MIRMSCYTHYSYKRHPNFMQPVSGYKHYKNKGMTMYYLASMQCLHQKNEWKEPKLTSITLCTRNLSNGYVNVVLPSNRKC